VGRRCAIGLYRLLAFSVVRRTREIGIRIANSSRSSLTGMFLRERGGAQEPTRALLAFLLAAGYGSDTAVLGR